jgi:hypothetical protein
MPAAVDLEWMMTMFNAGRAVESLMKMRGLDTFPFVSEMPKTRV